MPLTPDDRTLLENLGVDSVRQKLDHAGPGAGGERRDGSQAAGSIPFKIGGARQGDKKAPGSLPQGLSFVH
jgi:hypothetical protein